MNVAGPSAKCDFKINGWFCTRNDDENFLSLGTLQPSTSKFTEKKSWNHYVLASESSQSSDEGSETAQSIQGKETDLARDTSDLDSDEYSGFVEYDVASEESNQGLLHFIDSTESASDDEIIKTTVIQAIIPEADFLLADSEDSLISTPSIDSEISPFDYWKCAQCQNTNNNPMFRYCERCYKVRKDFFPPPPKHKKPRTRKRTRKQKKAKENANQTVAPAGHSEGTGLHFKHIYNDSKQVALESDTSGHEGSVGHVEDVNTNRKRKLQYHSDTNDAEETKKVCRSFLGDSIDMSVHEDLADNFDLKDSVDSFSQPVFNSFDNAAMVYKSFSEPSIKFSKDDLDLDNEKLHPLDDSDLSIAKVNCLIGKEDKSVGSDSGKVNGDMCIICFTQPKSGVFVHGRIAHICCCYKCSVKVWMKTKRCPICKCKVSNVLRAFVS